jgi:hypothetical protein
MTEEQIATFLALVDDAATACFHGGDAAYKEMRAALEFRLREVAPPAPEPTPYCHIYEWDGPFGVHQSTSSARYNGMAPHRSVPVFTKPTEATHTQPAANHKEVYEQESHGSILGQRGCGPLDIDSPCAGGGVVHAGLGAGQVSAQAEQKPKLTVYFERLPSGLVIEGDGPPAQAEPVARDGQITKDQLDMLAKELCDRGELAWSGFRRDAEGRYTIPDTNPSVLALVNGVLAAAPTQPRPQPLTDTQVLEIWDKSDTPSAENDWTTGAVPFARAIEKAHGITAQEPPTCG